MAYYALSAVKARPLNIPLTIRSCYETIPYRGKNSSIRAIAALVCSSAITCENVGR